MKVVRLTIASFDCYKSFSAFVDTEGNVSDVSFELWGRFYHPNVRDQVLAKVRKFSHFYHIPLKLIAF